MDKSKNRLDQLSPEKRALLAQWLKEKRASQASEFSIQKRPDQTNYPISFAQQRLWLHTQFNLESAFYNIPAALRLSGPLHVAAFEHCLNEIIRRHEVTRSYFPVEKGYPVQKIHPVVHLTLEPVDLCNLTGEEQSTTVEKIIAAEARTPFDLAKGPLVRAWLLRLSSDQHIFLFTMHHIVSDGWSIGVLVSEIQALYPAFQSGLPSPLPELAVQYADYAEWQQKWLRDEQVSNQLKYWKEQLNNYNPLLELPSDRPRPATLSYEGRTDWFTFPDELYQGLVSFCQLHHTTLFTALLTAFQILLYRYTGQEDFNIGTPIANRRYKEIESLVGFFVNTLVVRAEVSADITVNELLQKVHRRMLESYEHQDVPFDLLVETLQPDRNISYSPLFQVMFAYQNTTGSQVRIPGLKTEIIHTDTGASRFDLTLSLQEEDRRLFGFVEYATDLFDPATIQRMLSHLTNIIGGMLSHPESPISSLPLLSDAEYYQSIVEWNKTSFDFETESCAHRMFEEQVRRTPEKTAILFEGEEITYRELNQRANQLAHYLVEHGVGPEVKVGLFVGRSPEMIVAMLAVLKAGGAYLPMDPNHPSDRLDFMLQDAGLHLVITRTPFNHLLTVNNSQLVDLDQHKEQIASQSAENLADRVTSENLAYIIYTSGSTGKPKGVLLHHAGLCNLVNSYIGFAGLGPRDRIFQFFSYTFDGSVADIFVTLLSGSTLCMVPQDKLVPGAGMVSLFQELEITAVLLTPSALSAMPLAELPNLRIILCGGESVPRDLAARWGAGRRFLDVYGPTEITVICSCHEFDPESDTGTSVPIGRPIPNMQLYVLDRNLQPCPIGVPGELHIGGIGVAHGYLNRPELTAERFIKNPFNSGKTDSVSHRLYKSGDLARYRPDGSIEVLGRTDTQVKIRGYRIELEEIESVLKEYPDVREAAILAREDIPNHRRLVAYIVPHEDAVPQSSAIQRFLKTRLPDYMVPAAYVFMTEFPLNSSGKLNRSQLPAPVDARVQVETEFIPPRTELEGRLAEIWQSLTGAQNIGIYDNFFELGGNSIQAAVFTNQVQDLIKQDVSIQTLYTAPTIADYAAYLETRCQSLAANPSGSAEEIGIPIIARDSDLPLSFSQQRLWVMDQLVPGSAMYNVAAAYRIRGQLIVDILIQAFEELIHRHEVLRTVYEMTGGRARPVIREHVNLPISVTDFSRLNHHTLTEAEQEALIQDEANREARAPFNLAVGPLVRARLLRFSPQDHVILVTQHHILTDGWSSGILIRELGQLYQAFARGLPSPLPAPKLQYVDYAAWQRSWIEEHKAGLLAYWKDALAGFNPLIELPADHPRPVVPDYSGSLLKFKITGLLYSQLMEFCRQHALTPNTVLLAAYEILLYRYSGQEDFTIGFPVANRSRKDLEDLIGFFVNTLVLRATLEPGQTFLDLVKQVSTRTIAALDHQDLPFEILVDAIALEHNLNGSPLFQVMFAYEPSSVEEFRFGELVFKSLGADSGISQFDLSLMLGEDSGGLHGAFEYSTELFERMTVTRMLESYLEILQAVTSVPQSTVKAVPLMQPASLERLLQSANEDQTPYNPFRCAHELFEQSASQSPDQTALVMPAWDGQPRQRLTYAELEQRSNQLAHYLIQRGAGPGKLIGLCLPRSIDLMVGLLGILKSGSAFVPLDPAYPATRLQYMLETSQALLVVTLSDLLDGLPAASFTTVCLDTDQPAIAVMPVEKPSVTVTPKDLAYVIFTSGSTGKPKGVMVQHASLVNHNLAMAGIFGLTPQDHVLQFSTINFDAALEEIFPTWSAGAAVVMRPGAHLTSAEELLQIIQAEHISVLDFTTAYWHELVTELQLLKQELPKELRLLVIGGDKAGSDYLARWQTLPGANKIRLLNTYGPTEGTIVATSFEISGEPWPANLDIPIGKPIPGNKVYILDKFQQPVPVGIPGELCIAGRGVALGYLNQPDLTAARFLPDQFSSDPEARIYRTGDLVKYDPDGNIIFLGRTDQQVKIRGYRIEPGEIETQLMEHPSVRQVHVAVWEPSPGIRRLVAYLVAKDQPVENAGEELRSFLLERVPEYMVPADYVWLAQLPLTINGKLDTRALPPPDLSGNLQKKTLDLPATEKEQRLVQVWQHVLGHEHFGIYDNFFEVGGDSILVIQVVARARQLGLNFTARQMFEYPTLSALALVAEEGGPAVSAEQGLISGPVPLTPIQRWFFDQSFDQLHHWNQAIMLEIDQELDQSSLSEALNLLVQHHDILRARYIPTSNGWQQTILSTETGDLLTFHDLSAVPPENMPAFIEKKSAVIQASLNIERGPVLQAAWFRSGAGMPGRLLIAAHHLVIDGFSWRTLVDDLFTLYHQLVSNSPTQLPPKTSSFKAWAERLESLGHAGIPEQNLKYWLQINPAEVPCLKLDNPAGSCQESDSSTYKITLDPEQTLSLLHEVPPIYGTDINEVLLAALVIANNATMGVPQLWIELEGHGRVDQWNDLDVSRTTGWFTMQYPILLAANDPHKTGDCLKEVKEELRRVSASSFDYWLARYYDSGSAGEKLRAMPEPEISFNYLGQFDAAINDQKNIRLANESVGASRGQHNRRTQPVIITGWISGGQFQMEWSFSRDQFSPATITGYAEAYRSALTEIIKHCRSAQNVSYTPSDFADEELSQQEIEGLLDELSDE